MNQTKPTALKAKVFQKIYWGDFLKETMPLHGYEKGAYLLLIACYFLSRRPLPDDDLRLAVITGLLPDEWRRLRPAIEPFFEVRDGRWYHQRIEADIRHADAEYEAKQFGARTTNAKRYAQRHAERPESESDAPPESPLEPKTLLPCLKSEDLASSLGSEPETLARVKQLIGPEAYHQRESFLPELLRECPRCFADALAAVEIRKKRAMKKDPEMYAKEPWVTRLIFTRAEYHEKRHANRDVSREG